MTLMSDTVTDPTTVVRHPVSDAPEQIAADMLSAAFASLSGVPIPTEEDRQKLADAQALVLSARRLLGSVWPIV